MSYVDRVDYDDTVENAAIRKMASRNKVRNILDTNEKELQEFDDKINNSISELLDCDDDDGDDENSENSSINPEHAIQPICLYMCSHILGEVRPHPHSQTRVFSLHSIYYFITITITITYLTLDSKHLLLYIYYLIITRKYIYIYIYNCNCNCNCRYHVLH